MAYVPVPKDLSKIKTKLAFNLTKRQLVCFSGAAAVGLPAYLFSPRKVVEAQLAQPAAAPDPVADDGSKPAIPSRSSLASRTTLYTDFGFCKVWNG